MAIPIPDDVRELLQAPSYVHLSTLHGDGSPRNWVVWAGLEGDHILVWRDYWDYQTLMSAAPQSWHDRLDSADLWWLHDATGTP